MALNCPLNNNGLPLKVQGETFILSRGHTQMAVTMDGVGKRSGKGIVYLTTLRLVFVHQKFLTSDFKSFDIPLKFLYDYTLEMPIFGSPYFKASVKPLFNLLPGNSHFKIWLYQGGVDTFTRYLSRNIQQHKKYGENTQKQSGFIKDIVNGTFNHKALVDPDDPSTVYLVQPN